MFEFRIANITDIPTIQQITYQTWPIAYAEILSKEQLAYMLDLIYSTEALTLQMTEDKHHFLLAYENADAVAFADYSLIKNGVYKLHKLYALPNQQGKGLGRILINYIIAEIKKLHANSLRLNVNRFNKAKQFYEHLGFNVINEEDIDIGGGFFMNDYVLEKKI